VSTADSGGRVWKQEQMAAAPSAACLDERVPSQNMARAAGAKYSDRDRRSRHSACKYAPTNRPAISASAGGMGAAEAAGSAKLGAPAAGDDGAAAGVGEEDPGAWTKKKLLVTCTDCW